MKKLTNNRGQSLVEYMVIVALMAVSTMGIMRVLSQTTSVKLARITQSLQGKTARVSLEVERINKTDVRKKDMSNFFRGSHSNRDKK